MRADGLAGDWRHSDKKGNMYLLVALKDTPTDMKLVRSDTSPARQPSCGEPLFGRLRAAAASGGHPTQISERLGVPKSAPVRMAPPEKMAEALSVAPGSVTPFGIMSAGATAVRLLLDVKFKACERLIFHPFTNTKSVLIAPAGVWTHLAARSAFSLHLQARSLCRWLG